MKTAQIIVHPNARLWETVRPLFDLGYRFRMLGNVGVLIRQAS